MPDILIRYIPEITFNSFACNFGGLLGMWLGVSILSIISHFKSVIINYKNYNSNHVNIQFFKHSDKQFSRNVVQNSE